jgi:hypothetical protein
MRGRHALQNNESETIHNLLFTTVFHTRQIMTDDFKLQKTKQKQTLWPLIHKQSMPTAHVGEVSANFSG